MSVEFLPKQYAREPEVLKTERSKADNLLRREMERMDKERQYVLGAVERDQRRFQRSLEDLQARAEKERRSRGLSSFPLAMPAAASPMLSRHMYSNTISFDSALTHPLRTSDASASTPKLAALSPFFQSTNPLTLNHRTYSTNSVAGRSPASTTRKSAGFRSNAPDSAARRGRLAEPSSLTGPRLFGSSSATTSAAVWGHQPFRNDETKRSARIAPLVSVENPSPQVSPAVLRNTQVMGGAEKAASLADMRGDIAQLDPVHSPSVSDLSARNGASGPRRKLPHLSTLSRSDFSSTGGPATDSGEGVVAQDLTSGSRLNLKLVQSKVLFQDGHKLAVSLPRLTAANRPSTGRADEHVDQAEDRAETDDIDSVNPVEAVQGVNAQGGKSLAELFEEIKHCRYIRHYRPDGADDGTYMAWPE